jgi:hypothetical protein
VSAPSLLLGEAAEAASTNEQMQRFFAAKCSESKYRVIFARYKTMKMKITSFRLSVYAFCAFLISSGWFTDGLRAQSAPTIPLSAPEASWPAIESRGQKLGTTRPLSEGKPEAKPNEAFAVGGQKIEKKNYFGHNPLVEGFKQAADPVTQSAEAEFAPQIKPILNLEGLRNTGAEPPDPSGDVGKNHYIQVVNAGSGSAMRILDKQGVQKYQGATSEIWTQVNSGSIGDPIIQYDHSTDRWFLMEMQGGNELLIAVTETSDPLGAWDAYRFQTEGFPDYPKMQIWPNAIFVTVNEIVDPGGNQASGYALEKSALVSGAATFKVYRFLFPKYTGLAYQPATGADWEAGPPPPVGSPGLVFRLLDNFWTGQGSDQIDIWEVNVNWANVNQSTTVGPKVLFPAPFETRVCYGWLDCIDQPGTSQRITALDQIIMYRAPYRNFGDYESVVFNHISDITTNQGAGGTAGVRWYELRKYPGQDWAIQQQGTFAPSQDSRFMAMLSQDGNRNIGVGYSIASPQKFPSLGLTGRNSNDPQGVMAAQEVVVADGKTYHGGARWGDYCNMSVDPVDDRTFWFTGEYQPQNDFWATKIVSFQLQKDSFDISPFGQLAPAASATLGITESVQVQINNYGLRETQAVQVDLYFEGSLVASEVGNQVIQPDGSYLHTFGPKVNMSQVGKYYNFMFVTRMLTDKFAQNDTLRTVVRKLTSFDAGLKAPPRFNQEMCSNQLNLPVAVQNSSAVPLTSARINYKLNADNWKTTIWNGNLAPGEIDTTFILVSGLSTIQNQIFVATSLPNSMPDEDTKNDTIFYRLSGTGNKIYHYYQYDSKVGNLAWEIRNPANIIVASGNTTDPFVNDLCLNPGVCYSLRLKPLNSGFWSGEWALYTNNNQLVYYTEEVEGTVNRTFCVSALPTRDVGPWDALAPETATDLSAAETAEVRVRNYGSTAATNIPISVQLGTGQVYSETITDTIQPGSLYTHRFQPTFNLSSTSAPYPFRIVTTWPTDSLPKNDTLVYLVRKLLQTDLSVQNIAVEGLCGKIEDGYFQTTFYNDGAKAIEEVALEITLNGVAELDTVTLNLDGQESKTATLKHSNLASSGANQLNIRILGVNKSGPDQNSANDSRSTAFQVDATQTALYALIDANAYGGLKGMSWKLVRDADQILLAAGGPYADYQTTQQLAYCASAADCYTFTMYYPGAAGWPGKFSLNSSAMPVYTYSGAPFQDSLVQQICSIDACASLQLQLDITTLSAPGASDATVTLHGQGGTPPYFYSLNGSSFLLDSTYTGLAAGSYTAYVADINACKREKPFVIGTSSTQEAAAVMQVFVQPNPAQDLVRVRIPNSNEQATCILRSTQGTILLTDQLAPWGSEMSGIFGIAELPDGLYFLTVYHAGKAVTQKLVKASKN